MRLKPLITVITIAASCLITGCNGKPEKNYTFPEESSNTNNISCKADEEDINYENNMLLQM